MMGGEEVEGTDSLTVAAHWDRYLARLELDGRASVLERANTSPKPSRASYRYPSRQPKVGGAYSFLGKWEADSSSFKRSIR